MTRVALFAVLLSSFVVAACGTTSAPPGTGPQPPAQCGKAGRTGRTSCYGGDCSAGQYCRDSNKESRYCDNGCVSDDNCGANEWCLRCGSDSTGVCRSCSDAASGACKPAACERDTFADKNCVSPGKAYSCPSNVEPTGVGTCAQQSLPDTWCCGGAVKDSCVREALRDMEACPAPNLPRAFLCLNEDPADKACKRSNGPPGMWCCPPT